MARIKGDTETADKYMSKAKDMARIWESMAREGDHYRLAFDRSNTWSQKYNMVWDKLWNIHIFPNKAAEREIQYYLTKQNTYGLPLDSREAYTKSDWILWTASMSPDTETFLKFSDLVYKYVNETRSRVPLSDWYWTNSGDMRGFRARSVIGGHWMKVLMDKIGTLQPPVNEWAPAGEKIKTKWADEVTPDNVLPEYPRPLMERSEWMNLNGVWEFQRSADLNEKPPFGKKLTENILVPFPVESALSGIMEQLDKFWYRRTFEIPSKWKGKKILIHFGAVEYEAEVFINEKKIGLHKGGYLPFSFDITDAVTNGKNELIVRVYDPTDKGGQPRGKQDSIQKGIMYTPTSGIWQTVWLEPVSETHIEDIKIVPDIDKKEVEVTVLSNTKNAKVLVELKSGKFQGKTNSPIKIKIPNPKFWSPQNPYLYDINVSILGNDGKPSIRK